MADHGESRERPCPDQEGEVLGLRWADVDLDAGTWRVAQTMGRIGDKLAQGQPKTPRSRRTRSKSEALIRSIAAHRARQDAERGGWGEVVQWGSGICQPRRDAAR